MILAASCSSSSPGSDSGRGGSTSASGAGTAGSATGGASNAGSAGKSATGGAATGGTNAGVGGATGGSAGLAGSAGVAGTTQDPKTVSDKYNYAPSTRTLKPSAVQSMHGSVVNPNNVLNGDATAIVGNGSYLVLDFGKEVGGVISLTFTDSSDASQSVGVAFSESLPYVGPSSDQSNGSGTPDGAVIGPVPGASTYTVPRKYLRGGFRYLTVFLNSDGWVHLSGVSLEFSPDPERAVPNAYPNYFYSNDDTLNKAWYGGAYTFQTNIVRNHEGRAWPPVNGLWDNSLTVGEVGNAVLTDAAKRDRTVWPGDMAISLPTGYASLFDLLSPKNSLATLYNHQGGSGQLPYAGPPMNFGGSDTYHLWSLYGLETYYLYSGDRAFLDSEWTKFKAGVAFSLGEIDANGLLNVVNGNDWARDNTTGEGIQSNSILYGVLANAVPLAQAEGDAAPATSYQNAAAALKAKINATLWDSSAGAYKDYPTSTLYPEDGNSLAVWFGVTQNASQAKSISYVLNENWNAIGTRCPEFTFGTGTPRISSFAGSMELMSHFVAGYDTRGLDLIRRMWGFMLNDENGPQSTYWEGFDSAGNLAYQGSFTSSSHGWGSGPTSALTFYVLGVAPDSAGGAKYHVIPHPGDLTHVEGNLTLAEGKSVLVDYDVDSACKSFSMRVEAPKVGAATARIGVPKFGAKHTVLVDGVPAWDGAAFVKTTGIASASEDADYVYFEGVTAGVHTFSFGDGQSCAPAPEEWAFCSDENTNCSFTGTKRVRFGKRGHYEYEIVTGGTACDATTFGKDPLENVPKSCEISDELYTACSVEGQTCTFTGTKQVRFGLNGQWVTRMATGSSACDATTFGLDPLPNVVKRCEYRAAP